MIGEYFSTDTTNYDSASTQLSYQMIVTKFKQTTNPHPSVAVRMIPAIIHMIVRTRTLTILMIKFVQCLRIDTITMSACAQT